MLTEKSRTLLGVLAGTVLLCAAGVAVYLGVERLGAARSISSLYEEQIDNLAQSLPQEALLLSRRDELESRLASMRSRFYAVDEMSPFAFGALIKQELLELGMEIARYQVLEARGQSYLEFTAGGSALAMAGFLRAAFGSDKYWSVPSLTVKQREGSDVVDVVFQIGYEIRDGEDR